MRRSASDLAFLYIREAAAQEKKMETSPEAKPAEETSTTVKVFVHDSSFSSEELLVCPTAFPDVQNNSVVFVDFSTKTNESARVVLRATLMKDEDETTKSKRFALSLLKPVAEAFDVAPWADASVEPCNDPANEAAAEYVEFMFKDQFVSRADLCGRGVHHATRVHQTRSGVVCFSISGPFPRDESARRVTGRRPCRDRLYTTQVALQALGDWPDAACGPACRGGWHAGVDERAASERVLWCPRFRLCCGFHSLNVQNTIFKDLLVGAVVL